MFSAQEKTLGTPQLDYRYAMTDAECTEEPQIRSKERR